MSSVNDLLTPKLDEVSINKKLLVVKVSDTGIGINREDYKNLFKLFGKLTDKKGVNT